MIAFGPIPSRRLGFSIGINHIPPKYCSYSCVYCQVGRTDHLVITPRNFYSVEEIVQSVEKKIKETQNRAQAIDFLSFVPDGEPTLDLHLGEVIDALKPFGYPIAVISNATLMDRPQVRFDLCKADWVSLKVDSVVEEKWRKINRPYKRLNLNHVLMGMLDFAKEFQGELVTETMLIAGINDDNESITRLTSFLSQLQPAKSYLSIPIRPPAENQVLPPDIDRLDQIYRIVSDTIPSTIRLFTREENRFVITGDIVDDLLSTTAVHPLREDALKTMLAQCGSDWHVVEKLLREKKIKKRSYKNQVFYQRNLGD